MFRSVFGCLSFLLLPLLLIQDVKAQAYPDAGMWTTLNADIALNSKYTLLLTQEWRMRENYSRLNLFYTNIGVERKISAVKMAFVYRCIQKFQDDNTFSFRHRLMWDASVKKKFGKLEFGYRHRLQAEKRDIYTSRNGRVAEWYSRSKFSVEYDTEKRIFPNAAVELRYQILDRRNRETDLMWHRVRYQAGMDYKLNERSKLGLYYLIQREFNSAEPESLYVTGLEYSMEF